MWNLVGVIKLQKIGPCFLKTSEVGCWSIPSNNILIDTRSTLIWHLTDIVIDTWSTLDQHSINIWLIVGRVPTNSYTWIKNYGSSTLDWLWTEMLTKCWLSVNRGVNGVSIKYQLKLLIKGSDQHSTLDGFSSHDVKNIFMMFPKFYNESWCNNSWYTRLISEGLSFHLWLKCLRLTTLMKWTQL